MATKHLEVPSLGHLRKTTRIEEISESLNILFKHPIDQAPWPEFSYVPVVAFSIGHNNDRLFIKYYVFETVVKAVHNKSNEPVYKDSCVEFYIAFQGQKEYYNFEFNPIGTCKLNYGIDRYNRKLISEELISMIQYLAVIKNKAGGVHWELTVAIPVEIFSEQTMISLAGKKCAVNFYKCGDDLPVPHFLCWNAINSATPDFHIRECFGEMVFLER